MTRMEIVDGHLNIEVLGWHKLWAFKPRLSFPLEHVAGAERWNREKHRLDWRTIRAPGTSVPWVIIAGTYHNRGRHYFYDVCKFTRAVVIELRHQWYTRVIVEVEDPEAALRLIEAGIAPVGEPVTR
ncbi:MAG TPA: hypothetical protein VHY09_03670 [Candidatus Methylacidiphilales bacterium]|jgi:hypothetical protein|nr:hypothetical protein [Candidatus Methylacidiphilales bacterium]